MIHGFYRFYANLVLQDRRLRKYVRQRQHVRLRKYILLRKYIQQRRCVRPRMYIQQRQYLLLRKYILLRKYLHRGAVCIHNLYGSAVKLTKGPYWASKYILPQD